MSSFITAPWSQPSTVTRLVTPPAEELFTVEEIKLRAALSWPTTTPPDPRDQMIEDYIRAARAKVELDTGLALLTQVREVTFQTAPVAGTIPPLPPQCLPVQALQTISPTVMQVTAGWPTVDDLIDEAPGLHQAVGLLATHYATLGRDLAITGAVASINIVPEGYEALIEAYRLVWIP